MSQLRKLQSEMDKVLKAVDEHMEVFDDIYEQLTTTDNQNQRDKHESELKKEIKKLQRLRDQLKSWISGTEVKDKRAITEARKQIELRMERFKATEKEAKTKAFSRAGIEKASMLDPKEKERYEAREWLSESVDRLTEQMEQFEADAEELQGQVQPTKKGKKSPEAERIEKLETSITRHRDHVTRIEQIMRALDNDEVSVEDINDVRELVDDYLERNQEDYDQFEIVDDIYESLIDKLANVQAAAVPASAVKGPTTGGAKGKDEPAADKEAERQREKERAVAAAAKAQLQAQLGRTDADGPAGPTAMPVVAVAAPAAALAAAIDKPRTSSVAGLPPPPIRPVDVRVAGANNAMSPSGSAVNGRPSASLVSPAGINPLPTPGPGPTAVPAAAGAPGGDMVAVLAAAARSNLMASLRQQQTTPQPTPALQQPSPGLGPVKPAPFPAGPALSPSSGGFPHADALLQQVHALSMGAAAALSDTQQLEAIAHLEVTEPTAADLGPLVEFKDAAKAAPASHLPLSDVSRILQASYLQGKGVPLSGDAELPWGAPSKRRSAAFPASYPTTRHPTLESNQFLRKLDEQVALESAFFAFYQQPGTLQQYMAAQYLRSKSWR